MRRAKLPLDAKAVAVADEAVKAKTGGRLLTTHLEDAVLRKEWMDAYIEVAGPDSFIDTRENHKKTPEVKQDCPLEEKNNFIELQYSYADGDGVAGASYEVVDLDSNTVVARGTLDNDGYSYADMPVSTQRIKYKFYNDPNNLILHVKPVANEEQSKIEVGWQDRMIGNIKAGGVWVWGVAQGDFNEDQTVGQVVANMTITMVPFVDQVGDVRDITANLKFLIIDK
ncbi:MAG TPA: hypothetical protein VD794_07055, partial [Flavisolibacter sp.]|nr:hypothetical protein [Flavisolibacter sp.]